MKDISITIKEAGGRYYSKVSVHDNWQEIYTDDWNFIFDRLKTISKEISKEDLIK